MFKAIFYFMKLTLAGLEECKIEGEPEPNHRLERNRDWKRRVLSVLR